MEILCTGCKYLGKDYWVPCSDEPELKFEYWMCYHPDSPDKNGTSMETTHYKPVKPEWCSGKEI